MRKLHSLWYAWKYATRDSYHQEESPKIDYGQVAEAFPKTEAPFLDVSFRKSSFIWLGSPLKTVINTLFFIFLTAFITSTQSLYGQLAGCDIAIVPDDLDMQNRVQLDLDDACTACGIYGGNNGSEGMPPGGATGCAIIQIRADYMSDCMTIILDPQSSEKTDYYYDFNLMESACFTPDGSTEGQGESFSFMKDDLTLENGFYHLLVCSQSSGNRFFEVVEGCCPDPGSDVEVFACPGSEDEIDLFAALEGAEMGGTWDRISGSGGIVDLVTGTYTPGMDGTSSVFTYTLPEIQQLPDCDYTSEVTVTMEDITEPEIVCDDLVLSLSYNDPEIIDADTLIESMRDECGVIVSVQARRMEDPFLCGYAANQDFSDSIGFCCVDVGQIIMVELRVTDDNDNTSVCMAEVMVVDEVAPRIWTCVDDVTISCSYDIDLNDLSEFGTLELNQEDVDPLDIDDEYFQETQFGDAREGMFQENCPGWTIRTVVTDERDCNEGDIIRKFYVTDASGNSDSCEQRITIIDIDPFSWDDIMWPADVDYEDCSLLLPNPGPGPDPDETGWPVYTITDICSQPTATYNDLIFDDPTSGCLKVQRTWKVIDWCNYDKKTKEGSWTWEQYIKIINTTAPVWEVVPDTLDRCVTGTGCASDQTFGISATDDCTTDEDLQYVYEIDVDNDGDIDESGETSEFTIFLEPGTHKITWTVEDRCGNDTTRMQIVNVKECKAPTPICYWGLAASLSQQGETVIWASDFNNKSNDNCTAEENLVFSFSSDTDSTSMVLTCDDVGEKLIQMWATDEAGNQSYCETYILVQDNHEVCPQIGGGGGNITQAMIAGHIGTENSTPVREVQVNISGPELDTYQMTDSGGAYAFEALDAHYNYEVIPVKDDDPLVGVSTLDLVIVQQHILGIKELESPYKLIAADVNNSESISAIDLIQLRKMILGIYDAFPENNSWRFVESQYGILEAASPWPFIEGMYVEDLSEDMMDNNFIAVKIGDVNGSVEEKLTREQVETRSSERWMIGATDRLVNAGEVVEVTLTGAGLRRMIALQWTLSVDSDRISVVGWSGGQMDVSDDHFGLIDGEGQHLTFAWTDLESKTYDDGSELMTITLQARENGRLSDMVAFGSTITPAIGYNTSQEKIDIQWTWSDEAPGEVVLYQNAPNPFMERTSISFDLPQDMEATMELYDVSGKLMYRKTDFYNQGKNTILVNRSEIDGLPGVVYYMLKTENNNITKKMILLR